MKIKIKNCIGGYDASAWMEDGRVMFRFAGEAGPLDEWTRDRILDFADKHMPDCREHYVWLLTLLVQYVHTKFRSSPPPSSANE